MCGGKAVARGCSWLGSGWMRGQGMGGIGILLVQKGFSNVA
jgi:hypothetical protein